MDPASKEEKKIGPYKLIRSIAKGGMGEVFLAYDPHCRREIALKCIRSEYLKNETIYKRFVKEAFIASQLTHPNIIPIYSLNQKDPLPYYTMPYIEGSNLKQILVETLQQEKDPQNIGTPKGSIQTLTRIFYTICEAVSYAHQKQIIHRDLKPENILVGKYGEVLIFDWGVADKIQNISKEDPAYSIEELEYPNLTSPGKIIGTLSFLAPERFEGAAANYQTDIYSLGVMLYMILTLKLPFQRKKLKEAKKNIHKEVLKNPIEVAPYRDIPHPLVNITQKCLAKDPEDRYLNMEDLLSDLKNFIRGSSEWVEKRSLNFYDKEDWGFHENLLMSQSALMKDKSSDYQWVSLMVSKAPYALHTKLEVQVVLESKCAGIGLLLNASQTQDRAHPFEGYEVWLSADSKVPSKLYRNGVEILPLNDLVLKPNTHYKIQFEQLDNRLLLHLNGERKFSYLSYLALLGKQVGVVYKDAHFKIEPISVFTSSPSLIVSCLEVPKAFLANRNYDQALIEYRRIGHAFPGRHESREAFFRGGHCLLEKALHQKNPTLKHATLDLALTEFENLRLTPGAPLEYLGKALVYRTMNEPEEELKCLELALRRYPHHPLLYLVYDHIIYRMYQSFQSDRLAAFEFTLLALRYNAYAQRPQMIDPLMLELTNQKEVYFFLSPAYDLINEKEHFQNRIIQLSFLLGKAYVLNELILECKNPFLFRNMLTALYLLKEKEAVSNHIERLTPKEQILFSLLQKKPSKAVFNEFFFKVQKKLSDFEQKVLFILLDKAFFHHQMQLMEYVFDTLDDHRIELSQKESLDKLKIEKDLVTQNFSRALKHLEFYKKKTSQIHSEHAFLQGCYLYGTKGQKAAIDYFENHLAQPSLSLGNLAAAYLAKRLVLKNWKIGAFDFELMTFYRQLTLFYQTGQSKSKATHYFEKWKKYSYYASS